MAAYCNNFKPNKDDFNRKNRKAECAKHQELNHNIIKITNIAVEKKAETTTSAPVKKLRIDLHHRIRGTLVHQESEEEIKAKRKEILSAAEKIARQERHQIRQLEAEKFCKEYLQFTNFRIPVYESDEDHLDRLTFETVKYYAECAKYKPKKSTSVKKNKMDDKHQQHQEQEKGYSYSFPSHVMTMCRDGLTKFTDEERSESSSTSDEEFLKSETEEVDSDKHMFI